jgi:hypothetical protein
MGADSVLLCMVFFRLTRNLFRFVSTLAKYMYFGFEDVVHFEDRGSS